jgi:hypothetical protein
MARAVELPAVVGADRVDAALGLAAIAGRFAVGDLASIIDHLAAEGAPGEDVSADTRPACVMIVRLAGSHGERIIRPR